jgi:hypothetical protein
VKFFRSIAFKCKVVCAYVWKRSVKNVSKSVHNYTLYTDFSEPPRLTQMRYFQTAIFPKRLHRFGCAIYRWKGYDKVYVVGKFYWKGVPSLRSKYRSNVRKQRFRLLLFMHAKPQFCVYVIHDLGALRRACPTAIAVCDLYFKTCIQCMVTVAAIAL